MEPLNCELLLTQPIAKDLEFIVDAQRIYSIGSKADSDELYHSLELAASYLRAIAAGEYKRVVHGHYVTDDFGDSSCSECGENYLDCTKKYCSDCGALMDGKGDSHE